MGSSTLILGFAAALLAIYISVYKKRLPEHFGGKVYDPKFARVEQEFRQNFRDGWEGQGSALAVYYKGKLVVDIWGGYADEASLRKWDKDTLTTCFSATKALTSLAIAKLVNDGKLNYNDLVSKHWPEFGKLGKEQITVRNIVSHEAGLSYTIPEPTYEDIASHQKMSKLLENQKPHWKPGDHFGYHSLTHGWLCDQIVRRVDGRGVKEYIEQELVQATGSEEFYVGLPTEHQHRLTRLNNAGPLDDLYHATCNWDFFVMISPYITGRMNELTEKTFSEPSWLLKPIHEGRNPFNNPDNNRLVIPSAGGYGTARGLAQPFMALTQGKLLREDIKQLLVEPMHIRGTDIVMNYRVSGGHGFCHTRNTRNDTWQIGHPGHGGQNVKVDFKHDLAFAHVTNSLKLGMGDLTRTFARVQKAIYNCID